MTSLVMRIATACFIDCSLALALAVSVSCGGSTPKALPTADEMVTMDPLPLNKGAKWTYNVTVKRFDPDAGKDVTHTLQWVTEVVDAREANGVTAYRIRGWVEDLEASAMTSGAGMAAPSGSGGSAATTTEPAPTATERTLLRSGNAFLWGATADPSLDGARGWFRWPIHDGQTFCPDKQVSYCWQVSSIDTGYAMSYYTGPDEQRIEIEPGTGVSRFHYVHHGTVNEVDAKLTSYSNGK
jgi:hypothetical protein